MGLRDLVLFNIAAVLGIRWLAAAAHTGPGSITLWMAAALLFFVPSALAVASLSARHPDEGGIYVWTRMAFGEWHGFVCGWCYWLSNVFFFPNLLLSGVGMALYSLGLAENKLYTIGISLLILWIALLMNLAGVGIGKWANNAGALATYSAGALIIALGAAIWIRSGPATPIHALPKWNFDNLNFWSQIAFAFGGLELGAVLGGEIRNPGRTVPRAAWISGLAIAGMYILGTLSLLALLTPERINIMTGLVQAAQEGGTRLGAPWLASALTGLILVGILGSIGAWLSGSARIPFVFGVDSYLPKAFGKIHPRWRTPYLAILAQGIFCTVFLAGMQAGENLSTGYQLLVDMTVITYFIPFLYLFATAWKNGRAANPAPLCGLLVTSLAIGLSLVPPAGASSVWLFELKLVGGCALLIVTAKIFFMAALRREAEAATRENSRRHT